MLLVAALLFGLTSSPGVLPAHAGALQSGAAGCHGAVAGEDEHGRGAERTPGDRAAVCCDDCVASPSAVLSAGGAPYAPARFAAPGLDPVGRSTPAVGPNRGAARPPTRGPPPVV